MPLTRTRTSKGQKGYTHAMNRIPPSRKIGKKMEALLNEGLDEEGDITSLIIHLGAERLVQELLKQEVTTIWNGNTINGAGQSRNTAVIAMATKQGLCVPPGRRSWSRCLRCEMRH